MFFCFGDFWAFGWPPRAPGVPKSDSAYKMLSIRGLRPEFRNTSGFFCLDARTDFQLLELGRFVQSILLFLPSFSNEFLAMRYCKLFVSSVDSSLAFCVLVVLHAIFFVAAKKCVSRSILHSLFYALAAIRINA